MRSGVLPAAPATEEFTKDDFELDSQVIIRLLAELKEEVRREGELKKEI